jgi:hypothetical protein
MSASPVLKSFLLNLAVVEPSQLSLFCAVSTEGFTAVRPRKVCGKENGQNP